VIPVAIRGIFWQYSLIGRSKSAVEIVKWEIPAQTTETHFSRNLSLTLGLTNLPASAILLLLSNHYIFSGYLIERV
jgi:hypothetical protein